MIEQISNFFNLEMIYLWLNFGILPFWFILIFFPQSNICKYLVTSIFPYLILVIICIYLLFENYKNGYNFLNNFSLYLGVNELSNLIDICRSINLDLMGLMCIPPENEDPNNYFKEMNDLNKSFYLSELSMGMSADYLKAVDYSSTFLRIGSSIFGNRF